MLYEDEGRDKFIWFRQIFINAINSKDAKFSSRLALKKKREHPSSLIKRQVALELHITVFTELVYFRQLVKIGSRTREF